MSFGKSFTMYKQWLWKQFEAKSKQTRIHKNNLIDATSIILLYYGILYKVKGSTTLWIASA